MLSPHALALPYADWRTGQRSALRTILRTHTRHVVVTAPTGAGKSVLAAALSRLQPEKRHVILTATKALQDQYSRAFPFLEDLRGARNYLCEASRHEFRPYFPNRVFVGCDEGPCHDGVPCHLKQGGCLYFDRRRAFLASPAGLTNYATWLTSRRLGQGLGTVDRLICDEAHDLPEQLLSACRLEIPSSIVDLSRFPDSIERWSQWAARERDRRKSLIHEDEAAPDRLLSTLERLASIDPSESWAWELSEDHETCAFEPCQPRALLPSLADGSTELVYLSATITPATLEMLGIADEDITLHTMPSTFPPSRRPVYFVPGARVDFRTLQDPAVVARWIGRMDEFLDDRPDRKGLIHTISFARARLIYEGSRHQRRMLLHTPRRSGADLVTNFRRAASGTVLVSPSVMTGFDFPYTEAEFQIVAKLPFPDTRRPIMQARIKAIPRYRDHYTMQMLVQACGRIVRATDDHGETAVVDEHVSWWYPRNRDLAPDWFDEAVIKTRKRLRPFPALSHKLTVEGV